MPRVATRKTKAEAMKIVRQKNRMTSKSPFDRGKISYTTQKTKTGWAIYKNKRA